MFRVQPPEMVSAASPQASSTTYRLHVPLGAVPLKAPASVVFEEGDGAGAGKGSTSFGGSSV